MPSLLILGQGAMPAPTPTASVALIKVIAAAVCILIIIGLYGWMQLVARRRRGVRLGVGIGTLAFAFILSELIYRMNPESNLLVAVGVALVLTFAGGMDIGTAVYPKSLRSERDI